MTGKLLAEILDQNRDGRIDDLKLRKHLRNYKKNYWIAMPVRQWLWENVQADKLAQWRASGEIGRAIAIPAWTMNSFSEMLESLQVENDTKNKLSESITINNQPIWASVILEKIHNFLTYNWAIRYPETFGLDQMTPSILGRETMKANCVFWKHPVNTCPIQVTNGCTDLRCNAVAFHHQVGLIYAGMEPAWYSKMIPRKRSKLMKKLSPSYKKLLKKNRYHQLQKPLKYDYPICEKWEDLEKLENEE